MWSHMAAMCAQRGGDQLGNIAKPIELRLISKLWLISKAGLLAPLVGADAVQIKLQG